MQTLIKSYKSRKVILELRKFRNGYCIIKLVREGDDWVTEWRHSGVKGLDRASNLMFKHLLEEEGNNPFLDFKIYSRY